MDKIKNISDLRVWLHKNERPIYFVSATNFNLMGMEQWINQFHYINYIDCFDGRYPNLFVPTETPHAEFESIEDINNYLLSHKEVVDRIERRGGDPVSVFLMFDEKTENLAEEIGLDIWFPAAKLRQRCDNKMETVRIGNAAGVHSVPNALEKVLDWESLMAISERTGLGTDLVIQTAFGDSGHTTFFISNKDEFEQHKDEIAVESEVKIMKRINCRGATVEACATQSGTLVGPVLTEVVGAKELTPYRGGWCGNEVFPTSFTNDIRNKIREKAAKFGNQLLQEGYRGYFNLDFLIDVDSGEVYLGELNPRICGASAMTNHAAFAYADVPLFLFHLLEFSGKPFDLNVDKINERWANPEFLDSWSQVVIKHTADNVDRVTHAPPSGLYRLTDDGAVAYQRFDTNRRAIETEQDAFFLRITGKGDYRYEGADLGILITRGRSMDERFKLTPRAQSWIRGIKQYYGAEPIVTADAMITDVPVPVPVPTPSSFKML